MKFFKDLNNLFIAVLFIVSYVAIGQYYFGINPTTLVIALVLLSIVYSFVPKQKNVLNAGIYREVWTGEIIKYVTAALKATFLEGIKDYSKYVSNVGDEAQAIHLASMNVLPEVLINNTTYPIPIVDLAIQDIIIQLDKFNTTGTPITDDEIYASSVKKMENVKDLHGKALAITIIKKALHALSPSGNTAKMPVIITTGANDGTGRLRMTMKDLLTLKTKADDLEIEESSRRLVLANEHVNDLILEDSKLEAFFYNRSSGQIQKELLSFDIHTHVSSPYYNPTTKAKLAYGAVPSATDRKASTFFSLDRAAKATGWTKMYLSKAEDDPQNQRSLVNYRQNAIVLPTAEEHRGAIVSGNAS